MHFKIKISFLSYFVRDMNILVIAGILCTGTAHGYVICNCSSCLLHYSIRSAVVLALSKGEGGERAHIHASRTEHIIVAESCINFT